ncbi:MAG: hypothetical protein AAFR81_23795 [Chloroflexota bacterium]
MADMVQMQEQSRKSFFQWHVLLVMKKKQLQKTLSEAGVRPDEVAQLDHAAPPVVDSDELALLLRFGLPVPSDLTDFDLPERALLNGISFYFRAAPSFDTAHEFVLDCIRQRVDGEYERCELMRVHYEDRSYLRKAAEKLNQALGGYGTVMVFNAARVWSGFHGAVVMDWEAVSARLLGVDTHTDSDDWYLNLGEPDQDVPMKRKRRIDLSGRKRLLGG